MDLDTCFFSLPQSYTTLQQSVTTITTLRRLLTNVQSQTRGQRGSSVYEMLRLSGHLHRRHQKKH